MEVSRLPLLLEEVKENLRSTLVIGVLQALLAMGVGFGGLMFSMHDVASIARYWERQVEAGNSVFVVSSDGNRPLAAERCDGVNEISGVLGAGGILDRVEMMPAQAPSGSASIVMVTPGYPAANWDSFDSSMNVNVVAPVDFRDEYGVVQGQSFVYNSTTTGVSLDDTWQVATVDWVPNERGRFDGINDALIMVRAPIGVVQSCLIASFPASMGEVRQAVTGWFGEGFRVEALTVSSDIAPSSRDLMASRASVWALPLAGCVIVVLHALIWFGRRSEFALYRALGLRNRELRSMLVLETVAVTLLPYQFGALLATIFVVGEPLVVIQSVAVDYLRILMLVVIAPVVGGWVILRIPAVKAIKGY